MSDLNLGGVDVDPVTREEVGLVQNERQHDNVAVAEAAGGGGSKCLASVASGMEWMTYLGGVGALAFCALDPDQDDAAVVVYGDGFGSHFM